jgi:hypothetical protein
MWHSRKVSLSALALFALSLGGASTAQADVIVVLGVDNQGTANVLLNPATDVLTVTGTVGANNLLVNFTSTSGSHLLDANPSGLATVSGGLGNSPFTELSFGLANNATFTRAVFNIDAAASGSVVTHVEGVNITGGFFEDDFTVAANAQNFFTITSVNGQLISSISLTAINGAVFEGVQQVRLGGGEIASTVPEPMMALLWAAGLAGIAGWARRCATPSPRARH